MSGDADPVAPRYELGGDGDEGQYVTSRADEEHGDVERWNVAATGKLSPDVALRIIVLEGEAFQYRRHSGWELIELQVALGWLDDGGVQDVVHHVSRYDGEEQDLED